MEGLSFADSSKRHPRVSHSPGEKSDVRRRSDIRDEGNTPEPDPLVEAFFEDTWSDLPPSTKPDRPREIVPSSEPSARLPDIDEVIDHDGNVRLRFRPTGLEAAREKARNLKFTNAQDADQAAQLRRRLDALHRAQDAKDLLDPESIP